MSVCTDRRRGLGVGVVDADMKGGMLVYNACVMWRTADVVDLADALRPTSLTGLARAARNPRISRGIEYLTLEAKVCLTLPSD